MFTSRAEFRLALRADNADQRLTDTGRSLGIVGDDRWMPFQEKMEQLEVGRSALQQTKLTARSLSLAGVRVNPDSESRNAYEALSIADAEFSHLVAVVPELAGIPVDIQVQLKRDALYVTYIARQKKEIEALQRDEAQVIPEGFTYAGLPGLSNELASKLGKVAPSTIAQAARIDGMTPAALLLILAHLRKSSVAKSA